MIISIVIETLSYIMETAIVGMAGTAHINI